MLKLVLEILEKMLIMRLKKIEISTDHKAISEKEIQTLTDNHINKIDEIFSSKEKEILSI